MGGGKGGLTGTPEVVQSQNWAIHPEDQAEIFQSVYLFPCYSLFNSTTFVVPQPLVMTYLPLNALP